LQQLHTVAITTTNAHFLHQQHIPTHTHNVGRRRQISSLPGQELRSRR
jgi:hypothetical protein